MRHRVEHGAARARQEVADRGVAGEVGAQRHQVDEVADHLPPFAGGAARHGGAGEELLLAAPAGEHGLPGREQGHEGCCAVGGGEPVDRLRACRRGEERLRSATPDRERAPLPVGRQIELRRPGQALPPVLPQPLPFGTRELLLLPAGEVGVQRRRRGQGLPGHERAELAGQHGERPEVRRDVMHGENEEGFPAAREEGRPEERAGREIERAERLRLEPRHHLRVAPAGRVHGQEPGRGALGDLRQPLHRTAGRVGEGGAQHGVAVHQSLDRASQGAWVRGREPRRAREVVGGILRRQAV